MKKVIRLGISTCPNDTFAFHALMAGQVDTGDLEFQIELLDIQQLNDGLWANRFDVAKASFAAALGLSDRMLVMPSGSALGFGVGPLLLAHATNSSPSIESQTTLCPGKDTTATLLFRIFYPNTTKVEQVVFSQIMPSLVTGNADFGVCIHEGRFTWESSGLSLVEDLGERWERETQCPLPLGGLLVSKSLPTELQWTIQRMIRSSIEHGLAQPEATLPTMRKYAQEFSDDVLMQHVKLYVNDWTVELGEVGHNALQQLSKQARNAGVLDRSTEELQILR